MPETRTATQAGPGRTRRLLRGLTALVALILVIVGVPALLIALRAYPHSIPAPHTIWTTLTTRDDGQLIYGVLAAGVWICWALFTLATLDELIASMRGRTVPHLPALGAFQRPAAGLISAVLLMFAAAPLAAVQPHNPEATSVAGPTVTTTHSTAAETVVRPTTPPEPAHHPRSALTYQVRRHDTLWKIAQDHLGDPLRYREIRDLNLTRIGPDNELVAGTVLDMPADAIGLTRPPSAGTNLTQSDHPATVVVQPPRDGVHDSLWRIAERTLGDGERWPEIFALNKGTPQPDGHTLTQPSLIFPGETLKLPSTTSTPPKHDPALRTPPAQATPHQSHHHPSQRSGPPRADGGVATTGTHHDPPPVNGTHPGSTATRQHGISVGSELFVGIGLATALSGALAVARRRYLRRYVPGSGDRTDLPLAPVIYQLRMAQLRAEHDDEEDNHRDNETRHDLYGRIMATGPQVLNASTRRQDVVFAPALGIRDGREVALDLAATHGLGLAGAGGAAAARALLIAAVARADGNRRPHTGITVLVTAKDLPTLLGGSGAQAPLPATVRVVATLTDALDTLEAETLARSGARHDHDPPSRPWPAIMLVAQPDDQQLRRLQAVLDNGSTLGIIGLLLGHWPPGITAHVRADGVVATTNKSGESLHDARLFHIGEAGAADLLTLLRQAQPGAADRVHDRAVPTPTDASRPPGTDTNPARPNLDLEMTAATEPTPTASATLEITGPNLTPPTGTSQRSATALRPQRQPSSPATPSANAATATITPERRESQTRRHSLKQASATAPTKPGTPGTPPALMRITVLGPPRILWTPKHNPEEPVGESEMQREITGLFQPRARELLVFLAVHPDGASREALIAALWADNPSARTTNSLNTSLSRLRGAVTTATDGAFSELVITGEDRYRLDQTLVNVDYWRFDAALAARRAATTQQQRIDAYWEIVNTYSGSLADGLSTEWIETAREAIRRDAIDAVAALARATVAQDPYQTLDLLEIARAFDPHNEALYRDIMRLQHGLEQYDAIPRTLALLTTRLAEIDDSPTADTIDLAARLRLRHANTATHRPSAAPGQPMT